jgi:hypothetical protein
MKTFTIRETAKPGLRFCSGVEDPRPQLLLGFGDGAVRIDTCSYHRFLFRRAVQFEELQRVEGSNIIEAHVDNLDVGRINDEVRLTRGSRQARLCLVHVETAAGVGGKLWYEAGSYTEHVAHSSYVERKYNAFPPPGVEIVATGHDANGETHHLVMMFPGAHFRIRRSGELPPDLPTTLTVTWTGNQLRCEIPRGELARISSAQVA